MLASAAMLDHEEQFLFKEEILHLANAMAEPGTLDNVEDLLTDVITSPRFDSRGLHPRALAPGDARRRAPAPRWWAS